MKLLWLLSLVLIAAIGAAACAAPIDEGTDGTVTTDE
jgi:hypothetical protein